MNFQLEQWIERKEVPPVILLAGPKTAANACAKEFAKRLMGIEVAPHPDLHLYEIEGKSGTHSVLSMQHLIEEMALPPFEAKVKIFIIEDAHRMLPASSNSLLKTLEEPTANSFIVLISDRPELLLPTVVSRSRKVALGLSNARQQEFCLEPLFKAAAEKDYVQLFKEVAQIEETILKEEVGTPVYFQKIDALFEEILHFNRNLKSVQQIEKCKLALERHLKLRTVLLNFLFSI
ncbi:MAG TPA: hypothetical protein VLF61_03935 [Rhabdochlamydiaceae bacterium]|nr:hypothetical protein [Rhabdochlamydiaceae bacterium]